MEIKPRFRDPEKVSLSSEWRCPLNRGNKYKDYGDIFLGVNLVSPEWRRPKGKVPLYCIKLSHFNCNKCNFN